MIKKVAMVVLSAAVLAGIAALLTEKAMFAVFLPIFLLAGLMVSLTFQTMRSRLKIDEVGWRKQSSAAVYYLLWSGFFLFVLMMGMSHV